MAGRPSNASIPDPPSIWYCWTSCCRTRMVLSCCPASMVGVDSGSVLIVTLAWRSAEVAAASSVVILLVALAIRQYLRHEERVRARIVKVWRPLLTRVAIEEEQEPPSLPRLAARHRPFLMDEWNALQDAVRGSSVERLNALALRLGLDDGARHLMNSRHVGKQIVAIRALGHLREPGAC